MFTTSEDLLDRVHKLEQLCSRDPFSVVLMEQVATLKTKLMNLANLMETAKGMDPEWCAQFEAAFSPVYTLLARDLDRMMSDIKLRIGAQESWFNPTVGHA